MVRFITLGQNQTAVDFPLHEQDRDAAAQLRVGGEPEFAEDLQGKGVLLCGACEDACWYIMSTAFWNVGCACTAISGDSCSVTAMCQQHMDYPDSSDCNCWQYLEAGCNI